MSVLAVVPARGGSKGIPGKNLAALAGRPLLDYTLLFARACTVIDKLVVSTEDAEIAATARAAGVEVLDRPVELARDDTSLWPVLQHALADADLKGQAFDIVVVLEPTGPFRAVDELVDAIARLREAPDADGIVSVSQPDFNPIWVCVVEQDGRMAQLVPQGRTYERRQDVPDVFRINGLFFVFRASFVRDEPKGWLDGQILLHEVPELRALHIDEPHQLAIAGLMLREGLIELPWLDPR